MNARQYNAIVRATLALNEAINTITISSPETREYPPKSNQDRANAVLRCIQEAQHALKTIQDEEQR